MFLSRAVARGSLVTIQSRWHFRIHLSRGGLPTIESKYIFSILGTWHLFLDVPPRSHCAMIFLCPDIDILSSCLPSRHRRYFD